MEVLLVLIGLLVGCGIGYLISDRKAASLKAEITSLKLQQNLLVQQWQQEKNQLQQQHDKEICWMKQKEEEKEAMYQRMKTEFENLSHRIFSSNAEDFTRMSAEHLSHLLQPLDSNLKTFKQQIELAYSTEAKERFSLGERIKELVALNNRLSEEANNLTKALKGDSKVQGNWGEMILERLLQASGLIEGEHYFRQEFLKNEQDEPLINEESGQKMQPDILIRYPDDREMIIDSKVSLTAYSGYMAADDTEEQNRQRKLHLQSVRTHIEELSRKDYSRYDSKAPDFVMMFIPTEGAYLLAIETDPQLWEYAYNKKVVLMSPTNLISALRLSLDLWKREYQAKNVQDIINRGTALYEKIAGYCDTFLSIGERIQYLQKDYEKALNQLSEGRGSVIRQAEQLKGMGLTTKKKISQKLAKEYQSTELSKLDTNQEI